ncbi:REP-associated tyrosine transposase [Lacunimicrobium album]
MKQQSYDDEKHIHFITFSCFKRRKYAKTPRAKRMIIGSLGSQLARLKGICLGYVIMPDHVHTLVWFPHTGQLSDFLDHWKNQSSFHLKQLFRTRYPQYWSRVDDNDPIWQTRHYGFNIWNRKKVLEKLDYMHTNPIRAHLCERITDYPWSSARWYESRSTVYLPISWPPGLELNDH